MAKGGIGREGMMQSDSEEEELRFSCELCILPDAVVAVSRAAWLLGAVPCSLTAKTSMA